MTEYVLYYSSRDQNSKSLHKEFENIGSLKSKTTFVDVDKSRGQIPKYVQSIPTLVISSEKRVLVGSKAFSWLGEKKKGFTEFDNDGIQCYDADGMGGCNALCFSFLDQPDGFVCSQPNFCDLNNS
jgi:hypothetical protein